MSNKKIIISLFVLLLLLHLIIKHNQIIRNYIIIKITKYSNNILKKESLVGNNTFYNPNIIPESLILTKNWKIIRDEVLIHYKNFKTITNDLFFENLVKKESDWNKLYIKFYSDEIDPLAKKLCPKTCQIIETIPNLKLAFISVLAPNAKIIPHRGIYKGVLRFHLGLYTPNSKNCFISVNDQIYSWKDGEGIIFDDTFEHYVENNTNQPRIILFCDFNRPLTKKGKIINSFVVSNFNKFVSRTNG